jgi:large subunit ribosomal protein L9
MKVLFIKNVSGVGNNGQVKEVADGYAKNFLFPNKYALVYDEHMENVIKLKKEKESRVEKKTSKLFEKIEDLVLILKVSVHDGTMYGSVNGQDIVDALLENYEISLSKSQILLEKPLKKLGTYFVTIKLSNTLKPVLKIKLMSL